MGHAHHFLSRLDRLARQHVELALTLYRDDERLRYVLEQARVPEGAERIALSLDDPREGPFVLVTRTGHFVTCLGRGMRHDLPVISRADLDAISAKHTVFQEREAARAKLVGPDGEAGFIFSRLLESGPFLAREELQALAALHPLLGEDYVDLAFEWALASKALEAKLRHAVKKRGSRLWPLQLEQLRVYFQTFFASGHLAVLALSDGGDLLRERDGGNEETFAKIAWGLSSIAVGGTILSQTARVAWALAQLGPRWVPHGRRRLYGARGASDVVNAAVALLAIGAHHEAVREEVIAILAGVPTLSSADAQSWSHYLCPGAVNCLREVEAIVERHVATGREIALQFCEQYPAGSAYRYARAEDVPREIAFAHPFQAMINYTRQQEMLSSAITMIVPAARAVPEELYLPRRCVEFIEPPWEPEMSLSLMEGALAEARAQGARPPGPARKGPCPCGSGKKYKRCCSPEQAR
jgi:hypothetical protein